MKRTQLEHILRAAGREKYLRYIRILLQHRIADPIVLQQRLAEVSLARAVRAVCAARLEAML